jgi:hypothetical protein
LLTERSRVSRRDGGALTLLIIGFVLVAGALVAASVDASKLFLARRALSSAADAAALAAAQAVDRAAVYGPGGGGCDRLLPLDPDRAARAVAATLDDAPDLRRVFVTVDDPQTTVAGRTVSVRLAADVALPLARVVGLVATGVRAGQVHIAVTAHAQAPLVVPGGCAPHG